jgi:hypothetical protein
MNPSLKLCALSVLTASGLFLTGCKEKSPLEKAADSVGNAAEKAADATKEAADKAADAINDATKK